MTKTIRHISEELVLRFFEHEHLPEPLKSVAAQCSVLANNMSDFIDSDPELTAGLRKLLEAKDCFIRAKVAQVNREKGASKEGAPLPRPDHVV